MDSRLVLHAEYEFKASTFIALVRQVKPDLVLAQSLVDYMEDHMNTARVAVTATFSRNIPFFRSIPDEPAVFEDAMLYHATPHILTDMMRRPLVPEIYVDVTAVHIRFTRLDPQSHPVGNGLHKCRETLLDDRRALFCSWQLRLVA